MNELQYRSALRAIDSALDALAKMCEEYEREHFPIEAPTGEALALFRRMMRDADKGYTLSDLRALKKAGLL